MSTPVYIFITYYFTKMGSFLYLGIMQPLVVIQHWWLYTKWMNHSDICQWVDIHCDSRVCLDQ